MLLRENYTAEHISKLREETGADPSILERNHKKTPPDPYHSYQQLLEEPL